MLTATSTLGRFVRSFSANYPSHKRFLVQGTLAALIMLLATGPAYAQDRNIGYTVAPASERIYSSTGSALQSSFLYGGELGLSLGRYLEVGGEYMLRNGLSTAFSNVDALEGLPNRTLNVRRYGGWMRIRLGSGSVAPYIGLGTGVMRFEPRTLEGTNTIYAAGEAGLAVDWSQQLRFRVGGGLFTYQYDPVVTFLGTDATSTLDAGRQAVYSPALKASLALFLGGRSLNEPTALDETIRRQFGGGLRGIQLYVSPTYGRLEFNDALNFPKDQNYVGVSAGVELGPYIGWRAFYWRGTQGSTLLDDFGGGLEDIQLYGSELRFRLNTEFGRGFVPFAVVGGGYLDVMGAYEDDLADEAVLPDDRLFATGGVGLEVPLNNTVKLSGSARSLFASTQGATQGTEPGRLFGSLSYSAGLEFRLGGGSPEPRPEPVPEPIRPPRPGSDDDRIVRTDRGDRLAARIDSLERRLARQSRTTSTDTTILRERVQATNYPAAPASNLSDRSVTLPIPEVGELYLRIGEGPSQYAPGTRAAPTDSVSATRPMPRQQVLTSDAVQRIVQRALQEQSADTTGGLSQQEIRQIIQQSMQQLTREQGTAESGPAQRAQIEQLRSEIESLRRRLERQSDDVMQARREAAERPQPTAASTEGDVPSEPFYRSILGRPLIALLPNTGVRAGQGRAQFQVGVRGDYRQTPGSRFRLMPEATLGLARGARSLSILGNVAYAFGRDLSQRYTGQPLAPYAGIGFGFASSEGLDFGFVSNLLFGVDYEVRPGRTAFLEFSTLDFFEVGRFSIGYRVDL